MRKISELLREERLRQRYSLEDIQQTIKIKQKYLRAIEEGKFNNLPSEANALGFVKKYAQFLGIPESLAAAYFRREYSGVTAQYVPGFTQDDGRFNKGNLISPNRVIILFVFLLITVYFLFQYRPVFFGPPLEILEPKNGQNFAKNIVYVEGKTDQYASVTIDGDEAYVGIDGKFSKSLYVFSGEKRIIIISKNRFGKETRKEISVKVK